MNTGFTQCNFYLSMMVNNLKTVSTLDDALQSLRQIYQESVNTELKVEKFEN